MHSFAGKNVLIVGAGKSGLAAARYLRARGARITLSDTREASGHGYPAIGQDEHAADGFDFVFQSPGVPLDLPLFARARSRGVPVAGELEITFGELRGNVVGITGANGKTTTTALTGHIFQHAGVPAQIGGNIGTPITELVAESRDDGWTILELSSFQLETVREFRAVIGMVLNITPDHLDRHHTMENYIDAKARLVETLSPNGFAVLNAREPNSASLAGRTRAKVVWFNEPVSDGWIRVGGEALLPVSEIPLAGWHNVENTMAAATAAWLAKIPLETIREAVKTFPGVEHRIEFVRELDGVRYYNDSKATNVDATEKAILAFDGGLWIVLGGKDKNSDYRPLGKLLEAKAKGVLLIGAAAPIIREHLSGAAPSLPLHDCGTLEVAIRTARRHAAPGEVVLLSPACASFDQFDNYEHRGRTFKQLVQEYPNG